LRFLENFFRTFVCCFRGKDDAILSEEKLSFRERAGEVGNRVGILSEEKMTEEKDAFEVFLKRRCFEKKNNRKKKTV